MGPRRNDTEDWPYRHLSELQTPGTTKWPHPGSEIRVEPGAQLVLGYFLRVAGGPHTSQKPGWPLWGPSRCEASDVHPLAVTGSGTGLPEPPPEFRLLETSLCLGWEELQLSPTADATVMGEERHPRTPLAGETRSRPGTQGPRQGRKESLPTFQSTTLQDGKIGDKRRN